MIAVMIDAILDILTKLLIAGLVGGIIFGVIAFFLAATWMQVNDGKGKTYDKKASPAECRQAAPAAQRKRRRAAQGDPA